MDIENTRTEMITTIQKTCEPCATINLTPTFVTATMKEDTTRLHRCECTINSQKTSPLNSELKNDTYEDNVTSSCINIIPSTKKSTIKIKLKTLNSSEKTLSTIINNGKNTVIPKQFSQIIPDISPATHCQINLSVTKPVHTDALGTPDISTPVYKGTTNIATFINQKIPDSTSTEPTKPEIIHCNRPITWGTTTKNRDTTDILTESHTWKRISKSVKYTETSRRVSVTLYSKFPSTKTHISTPSSTTKVTQFPKENSESYSKSTKERKLPKTTHDISNAKTTTTKPDPNPISMHSVLTYRPIVYTTEASSAHHEVNSSDTGELNTKKIALPIHEPATTGFIWWYPTPCRSNCERPVTWVTKKWKQ
ncbi:hypothetical protein K1T71_012251 [Dendrolimus kikuchii]|uniref:Uncharacterized protein n=1 Tax=Dendrolimus kikuchii TaxID=765133 RepID=A0ACC1CL00_9NEOP|nr:hypothetical protein K1T71_012251 [Dendrolimus kikuchii]